MLLYPSTFSVHASVVPSELRYYSMSDKAEREEIREEAHELEDAEQDELEEDDDDYDEDETDQNT